jgi:hypothetical protein
VAIVRGRYSACGCRSRCRALSPPTPDEIYQTRRSSPRGHPASLSVVEGAAWLQAGAGCQQRM